MTKTTKTDHATDGALTAAKIERAIQRGHYLRSKAFTSFFSRLYRSIMGHRADHDRTLARREEDCAAAK